MRILLKGYYGFGNLGDDLLMMTIYDHLAERFPHASIDIFSNNTINNKSSSYPSGYNSYILSLIPRVNKLIDWTIEGDYDMIIDGGGGIYFDYKKASWFVKGVNSLSSLLSVKFLLIIEQFARQIFNRKKRLKCIKKMGLGISVGPYSINSQDFLRHHLDVNSYDYLLVRDKKSLQYIKNSSTVVSSSYDLVFSGHFVQKKSVKSCKEINEIGIVVLSWYENEDEYVSNLITCAEKKQQEGYRITFFVFDCHDDNNVITKVQGFKLIKWDPFNGSVEEYLRKVADMDLIISMRYHGSVLATCLGIPTIILAVSQKLEQLATQIPKSSISINPPLNSNQIINSITEICSHASDYQRAAIAYSNSFRSKVRDDLRQLWDQFNSEWKK